MLSYNQLKDLFCQRSDWTDEESFSYDLEYLIGLGYINQTYNNGEYFYSVTPQGLNELFSEIFYQEGKLN